MGTPVANPSLYPPALNRWLNINAVEPIRRTQGYLVVVPTFATPVLRMEYRGFSEKWLEFHYNLDHNLSILESLVSTNLLFSVACVSYVKARLDDINNLNDVVRYRLNDGPSNGLYTNTLGMYPIYNGERLPGGVLKVEFWNHDGITADNLVGPNETPVIVKTSVLGNDDTRAASDFNLENNSQGAISNFDFANTSGVNTFDLPFVPPADNWNGFVPYNF